MIRKDALKPLRKTIARTAQELSRVGGGDIYWASLGLGRISLRTVEVDEKSIYQLDHVRPLDEETRTYPAERFVFNTEGLILGVIRSRMEIDKPNFGQFEETMEFQVEHDLITPDGSDYKQLASALDSGLKDAPIIERID